MELFEHRCKNCGGTLKFKQEQTHTKCSYCQTEYEIRRNASGFVLNKFARCPICGENDLSRKLSAIEFEEIFLTDEGAQLTSKLASKIRKPKPPQLLENNKIPFKSYLNKIIGLIIVGLIIELIGFNIFLNQYNQILFLLAQLIVVVAIFGIILVIHNYFLNKRVQKIKVFNHNSKELIKFKQAEKKYNELYYCKRDGIVYSIDYHEKYFTLDNYYEYLYPVEF